MPECDHKASKIRSAKPTSPLDLSSHEKNARRGTLAKYNLRHDITLESLFVLFICCNPPDNFDVGVDS
jgi:hypothetical protein